MVAALILAIGVLGAVAIMDNANATQSHNKNRSTATNVAREVIEDADALAYSQIDPTTIGATLQTKPGLADTGGGGGWTIVRRGISYQLAASVCNIDDPHDGAGPHDASFCSGGTAAGTADQQPIDYKRVTVTVTPATDPAQKVVQSTLMFPSGLSANVPSVKTLVGNPVSPVTASTTTQVAFTATTSGTPSGVEFFVDDNPVGLATGSSTTWTYNWSLSGVTDGTYVISARAFNAAGVYGEPIEINYTLNRSKPAAPQGFAAGFNSGDSSVDMQWLENVERNVVGYHVYRQQTAPTTGAVQQVNCGTVANPVYLVQTPTCTDASPLSGTSQPVTVGNSTAIAKNGVTSLAVPAPTGINAGDVLLATFTAQNQPTGTTPPGWVLVDSTPTPSGKGTIATFYKIATASEPVSYTFTLSSKNDLTAGITDYSGVDTTAPVDAWNTSSGASGNAVGPSVTTTSANEQLVQAVGFSGATVGWNPTEPAGFTQRIQSNANHVLTFVSDEPFPTAGATGTFTTIPGGPDNGWVAQTIALQPRTIAVNYWVVACYFDPTGNLAEGNISSKVNAYAADAAPSPPTWQTTPLTNNADGTTTIKWNLSPGDPDPGDSVEFYRIYRDGQRYDTVGAATTSYVDLNPGGVTHTYKITAVDQHMAESTQTSGVTG